MLAQIIEAEIVQAGDLGLRVIFCSGRIGGSASDAVDPSAVLPLLAGN
jgi:hypothetical protein